jgi:hypothetical protein
MIGKKYYNKTTRIITLALIIILIVTFVGMLIITGFDTQGTLGLLSVFSWVFILFVLLWVTMGQTHIVLGRSGFVARTSFSKKTRPYSDLKAVCIVNEYVNGSVRHEKLQVVCENKKIRVRTVSIYNICILLHDFENDKNKTQLESAMYTSRSIKKHFGKHLAVSVRYTPELLEALLSHGRFPVYMTEETLKEINRDIQNLFFKKKINTTKTTGSVVVLACR